MEALVTIVTTCVCLILLSSIGLSISSYKPEAIAQPESSSLPRPVLLIHGYASTASVWEEWQDILRNEGINSTAVTFEHDDRCGDSQSHAQELDEFIQELKRENNADKINIVAHSKGGLDARVYLENDPSNDDIANLIMIGTPNQGSPLALGSLA
ncbi:MAG: esterase/lipase family protein, partial [Nitrososphaeraceae archaeon]